MAVNYEYVGTLKNGKHFVLDLDKTFEAGDEVPLTESQAANFAHRFNNVHKAKAAELKALSAPVGEDGPDVDELVKQLKAAEKAKADAEKAAEKAKADAEKAAEKAKADAEKAAEEAAKGKK